VEQEKKKQRNLLSQSLRTPSILDGLGLQLEDALTFHFSIPMVGGSKEEPLLIYIYVVSPREILT